MFWNLLTSVSAADSANSSATSGAGGCDITALIPWLLIIAAAVVLWFFSKRSQQKREQEINNTLDAIRPGSKVKTIGGICGTVVEVCAEDNTFILETGSETSGKSYMKFDKKAVYQTDAVPETPASVPPVEEAPFEEVTETATEEEVVEEAPATEEVEEAQEVESAEEATEEVEETESKEE